MLIFGSARRLPKNDGIIMRKALGVLIVLALSLLVGWWLVFKC